jgi:hypothetical protein
MNTSVDTSCHKRHRLTSAPFPGIRNRSAKKVVRNGSFAAYLMTWT